MPYDGVNVSERNTIRFAAGVRPKPKNRFIHPLLKTLCPVASVAGLFLE
jgi:hypothetical protein